MNARRGRSCWRNPSLRIEDRVSRSYGILSNAAIMDSKEAAQRLSDVRLGVDLGLLIKVTRERAERTDGDDAARFSADNMPEKRCTRSNGI